MTVLPEYCEEFRNMEPGQRFLQLNDIYKVFVPQSMAYEIYHKLYMMTAISLKQKGTVESIRQMNMNHRWGQGSEYKGVISGASSTSIIGPSGIGKTSSLQRSVELLGDIIMQDKPIHKIIPVVMVNCPFDCNYKGLLLQILLSIDEALGSNYYEKTQKSTYNAQQIMILVCQLCHLHVGVLLVDEIQNICGSRTGELLYKMLLQLINASGISVVLVGTEECMDYFQKAPQMARRTVGFHYKNLDYGKEFCLLTETLFRYQYVNKKTELTEGLISWLFEHTAGNPGNLMEIIHDSQEIAIIKGTEKIDVSSLTEAYTNRMKMLHGYIEPCRTTLSQTTKKKKERPNKSDITAGTVFTVNPDVPDIGGISSRAKDNGEDASAVFAQYYAVEGVSI